MRRTFMISAMTAALLAGCGGSASKTASTPPSPTAEGTSSSPTPDATPTTDALPDPCSLLTAAQAEALAGTKLNAPVSAGAAGTSTLCQRTGPTTGPTAQVEVIVGDGAKKSFDLEKTVLHHTFTSAPGIADEAFLEDGYVFVHKGALWAEINLVVLDADQPTQHERLTVAAAQMAAHM